MASTNLQQVIDAWKIFDSASTPRELRAAHEALMAPYPAEPDIESQPVDAGGVNAEWITAPNARADRFVVYLHGGGFVMVFDRYPSRFDGPNITERRSLGARTQLSFSPGISVSRGPRGRDSGLQMAHSEGREGVKHRHCWGFGGWRTFLEYARCVAERSRPLAQKPCASRLGWIWRPPEIQ